MYNTVVCKLLVSLALAGRMSIPAALAEDSKNIKADSPQTNVAVSAPDTQNLNALAHAFHQIHVSAKKLTRTCKSISDEFERTSLKILTFDEYINQYIDGKPVAYNEQLYPYGFQNIGNTSTTAGGPLPPRKEYVTHFVTEAKGLLSLITREIQESTSILSNGNFDPSIISMKKSLVDANASLAELMKSLSDLSEEDPYAKKSILNVCSDLSTKLSELDSACKLTIKMASATRRK